MIVTFLPKIGLQIENHSEDVFRSIVKHDINVWIGKNLNIKIDSDAVQSFKNLEYEV